MKVEEQCPTCNWTTDVKMCQKNRPRANQNEKGEFYKALECPLWGARVALIINLNVCPTCGQKIKVKKLTPEELTPLGRPVSELVKIEKEAQTEIPFEGIRPRRVRGRSSGNKKARKSRFVTD